MNFVGEFFQKNVVDCDYIKNSKLQEQTNVEDQSVENHFILITFVQQVVYK